MTYTVCLRPTNTLSYTNGGGHLSFFLNWTSGLLANGCRVIWLEEVTPDWSVQEVQASVRVLRDSLAPHGLADSIALYSGDGTPLPREMTKDCLDFDAAVEADLLMNMRYNMLPEAIRRFRRSALVDIDPGLLQVWWNAGVIRVAPHDVYFTIAETVGQFGALFPDCGVEWHFVPPPVSLTAWQPAAAVADAAYTTVSQWRGEWIRVDGAMFDNSKRASFLEYIDLPKRCPVPLELALCLSASDSGEQRMLEQHGWRVRSAWDELQSPDRYRDYIRGSRGEFSCAKPSCMRLQNAWVSERTLCYLASGKPAIVQHTGPSRFLPNGEGLFRFRTPEEARRALSTVEADYEHHCAASRALAEEWFDSKKVVASLLERALC